jgi:hypothetical protein
VYVCPQDGFALGIELPMLFTRILRVVRDQGEVRLQSARKATRDSHGNLWLRMAYLYQEAPEDGVAACYRAVLNQIALKGVLRRVRTDGGQEVWVKGPKFRLHKAMRIVKRPGEKWVSVTLGSKEEEEEDERQWREQQAATADGSSGYMGAG